MKSTDKTMLFSFLKIYVRDRLIYSDIENVYALVRIL